MPARIFKSSLKFLFEHRKTGEKEKKMKAVILTAGKGLRLRPMTATIPKPLLLVAGHSFLDHTIAKLVNIGVTEIILVVGHKAQEIKKYYENHSFDVKISFITQEEQLGTAHAFACAKPLIGQEAFIGLNGDVLISQTDFEKFGEKIKSFPNDLFVSAKAMKNPEIYGVFTVSQDYLVTGIFEKSPSPPSNLVNAGLYYFPSSIFKTIDATPRSSRGEYEITESINLKLMKKESVRLYELQAYWLDIGMPWDLLSANELLLKEQEKISTIDASARIDNGATLIGSIHVGANVHIRAGAYIQGPVYIDENAIVGPNCFIRACTYLGKNVHIGNAVEIKNSIILEKTNIGHLSYIGDSVIGRYCNFGAGTKVANLRLDNRSAKVKIKNKVIDSGHRKLGVFLGDNVKTGINSSLMGGIKIGPNSAIGAGMLITRDIEPNTLVYRNSNDQIAVRKWP
ncbi:MAG: bifunctional sugar-1-phosphate nucleotidylyltransferase/acetyltransferase [Candidatus Hodarchaeota archaeon]